MLRSLFTGRFLKIVIAVSVFFNAILLLRQINSPVCLQQQSIPDDIQDAPGHQHHQDTHGPIRMDVAPQNAYNNNQSASSLQSKQVIFVGGVPRSGTTLMRVMLDAHPDVHCGEETRVIPRLLSMRSRWDHSEKEHRRLSEAGVDGEVLDRATRAFISEVILGHGTPAKYHCNKDPLTLSYMHDVLRLYPKARFVLMVRDGRAVAHSIVSRNVTITGVNSKNYMSAAMFWNKVVMRMTRDCRALGKRRCLQVKYEELVKNPKVMMETLLTFLNVPWHQNVLNHERFINSEVQLSRWVTLLHV